MEIQKYINLWIHKYKNAQVRKQKHTYTYIYIYIYVYIYIVYMGDPGLVPLRVFQSQPTSELFETPPGVRGVLAFCFLGERPYSTIKQTRKLKHSRPDKQKRGNAHVVRHSMTDTHVNMNLKTVYRLLLYLVVGMFLDTRDRIAETSARLQSLTYGYMHIYIYM